MPFWSALALQASSAATFDLAHVQAGATIEPLSVLPQCRSGSDGEEIVVCGRKRDQYRLPLPSEREQSTERVRGDAASGMAALTPATPCGIFAGQRRCGKREAAQYGYGEGRDPITVLTKLAKKAVDPDD